MTKNPCVRTLIDSQYVKESETMFNLQGVIFFAFLGHSERKSAPKILF